MTTPANGADRAGAAPAQAWADSTVARPKHPTTTMTGRACHHPHAMITAKTSGDAGQGADRASHAPRAVATAMAPVAVPLSDPVLADATAAMPTS